MLLPFFERYRQGYRTMQFPDAPPPLPERFRGAMQLESGCCPEACTACREVCPVSAISMRDGVPEIDMGRCLFCPECIAACPEGKIKFTQEYRLCARNREALTISAGETVKRAESLEGQRGKMFRRSLKLREVSAGGCNACEADTNVLSTLAWDLGRFGIQFVASPRHADAMFVTGPVSENMREALLKTWEAIPEPKLLIACGACAISGGPFTGNPQVHNGIEGILPVDLYIPGCPPHPATIMDGLLRLTGRIP